MDKETLQLFRNNIIKDHRRRYLFVIKGEQSGYQVMEREMKFVNTYSAKGLYALLVFLMLFGILKQRFVFALLASAAVYLGISLYFKFIFLKDRNTLKIRDEEYKLMDSLAAHKEYKSEAFTHTMIPILMMFIIFSVMLQPEKNNNPIDQNLMKLGLAVLPVYSIQNLFKYIKERKIIKGLNNQ